MLEKKVLDHGFVRLRNLAGPTRRLPGEGQWENGEDHVRDIGRSFDADDRDPANAARISFDGLDSDVVTMRDGSTRPRTLQDDYNLNRYLLENEHTSPFEMIQVWLEVKVPIFIDRQMVRHRTWKRNEQSARYTVLPSEWYVPETVGGKSKTKKQGQEDNLPLEVQQAFKESLDEDCRQSYEKYQYFLDAGVAPEEARMFLHLNHYVHWIGSVDLGNLFKFLKLRCHEHAQKQARAYAEAIVDLIRPHLPQLMALFDEVVRK
jgi:thymidylate synthase (FAD)